MTDRDYFGAYTKRTKGRQLAPLKDKEIVSPAIVVLSMLNLDSHNSPDLMNRLLTGMD